MRIIKFRAWDDKKKLMIYDIQNAYDMYPLNEDEENQDRYEKSEVYQSHSFGSVLRQEWNIMQFTGLKDKKGKDIFEGDIVKYVGQLYPDRSKLFIVEWDDRLAGFYAGGGQLRRTDGYEVIGNIYENPELIP